MKSEATEASVRKEPQPQFRPGASFSQSTPFNPNSSSFLGYQPRGYSGDSFNCQRNSFQSGVSTGISDFSENDPTESQTKQKGMKKSKNPFQGLFSVGKKQFNNCKKFLKKIGDGLKAKQRRNQKKKQRKRAKRKESRARKLLESEGLESIPERSSGRKTNPLNSEQTSRLKLSPERILKEGIVNLNLKDIPPGFTYFDLELLVGDLLSQTLLINLPFNKDKKSFHEYCFLLMTSPEAAAELCRRWDQVVLVDIFGNFKEVQFHRGYNQPKEVFLQVLGSKAISDAVVFFYFN